MNPSSLYNFSDIRDDFPNYEKIRKFRLSIGDGVFQVDKCVSIL